jgi:hypothetical protein
MSARLGTLARNIPILLFLIWLAFTFSAGHAFADPPEEPKPEQPKSAEKPSPEKEKPQAPWGHSYSAGAKVTVQLDSEMQPEIRIENDQEGVSVCRMTSRKGDTVSKPRRMVLETESSTEEPFLGFKGFQSVTLEVDTGKVFFIVEQNGDAYSKQGYAEDRYLKTTKRYRTVGKGFLVAVDHNLLIKLAADSKETNGAEGYFKLFKGSYTDTIDSIPFSLQNGESETWEYPANQDIASWEITLTSGGIRISYRQPEKL